MPFGPQSDIFVKSGTDTDAASYTTASITPVKGYSRLVFAAVLVYDAGGACQTPTCSHAGGLSFTRIGDAQGISTLMLTCFFAVVTDAAVAAGAGAVTFNNVVSAGTADGALWIIFDWEEADTIVQANPNAAGNTTTADSLALPSLAAVRDVNSGVGAFMTAYDNAGGALTPGWDAGWNGSAEIGSTNVVAGGDRLLMWFLYRTDGGDLTPSGTVSAANDQMIGEAFEIGRLVNRTDALVTPGAAIERAGSW